MSKYIIKRILIAIPVLLGITIIDYAIMCLAGSPLEILQGPRISEAAVEAKRIALGLDKPIYVQYFVWLGELLRGNMGYSPENLQSVSSMIGTHLGPHAAAHGCFLGCEPDYGGSGWYLQRHTSVFQRRLYGGNPFLSGKQCARLFPVAPADFPFYGKVGWLPSSGMTTLGTDGGFADGQAYGHAGAGACHLHGRNEYPLYPKRGPGNPAAGLSAHCQGQGSAVLW